jgi:hypothetical protein
VALDLLYRFEQRFPRGARRLLRSEPRINAKAMGLFARGYLLLARSGDEEARAEADRRLDWLLAHPSRGYPGLSWGYPFDWQSRMLIPAGTPSAVVTATVGDAFRLRHQMTGGDEEALVAIATFLAEGLRRLEGRGGSICFSYTPIDSSHVHNANIIGAEYLLWAGHRFQRPEWVAVAEKAFRYTLDDQEESGAWDYWGPPDRGRLKRTVDPYHTGFVLRMLLRAHAITNAPATLEAARRGYRFMVEKLFDDLLPRATESRPYPVNGIAVGEGLLTHLAFTPHDPVAAARDASLLRWANATFRDPDGFYHYLWSPTHTNRLPMMRWVQAWMFLALASWLSGDDAVA